MYIRSRISQRKDGLWLAEIISSWLYFGEQREFEVFRSFGEAKKWLLLQRCNNNLDIDKGEVKDKLKDLRVQLPELELPTEINMP